MWKMSSEGVVIPLKVTPKASFNEIVGWENNELKIRIAAQPEKSNANDELIAFLSKELKLSKRQIKLISGFTSRHKRICLIDVDPQTIWFLKNDTAI